MQESSFIQNKNRPAMEYTEVKMGALYLYRLCIFGFSPSVLLVVLCLVSKS